jgi:hypothetical protein
VSVMVAFMGHQIGLPRPRGKALNASVLALKTA